MTKKIEAQLQANIMLIEINNPDLLNSIDSEMVNSLTSLIKSAESVDDCKMIIIYGRGSKAFCAGGDIKELYSYITQKDYDNAMNFFKAEYSMDLLIHNCSKPTIVIGDGITMGGGMGIAQGADILFATENTKMAMPETQIGFFPDVGATWWLNKKLKGGMPLYMGLTGASLKSGQSVASGLADYLMDSSMTFELLFQLQTSTNDFTNKKDENLKTITKHISYLTQNPSDDIDKIQKKADIHFSQEKSLDEIFQSLASSDETEILNILKSKSPYALSLSHRLIKEGKDISLEDAFKNELHAAEETIKFPDYKEGIRARIIDKDEPTWHNLSL
jgi:enoyl-CoA hydratase